MRWWEGLFYCIMCRETVRLDPDEEQHLCRGCNTHWQVPCRWEDRDKLALLMDVTPRLLIEDYRPYVHQTPLMRRNVQNTLPHSIKQWVDRTGCEARIELPE